MTEKPQIQREAKRRRTDRAVKKFSGKGTGQFMQYTLEQTDAKRRALLEQMKQARSGSAATQLSTPTKDST